MHGCHRKEVQARKKKKERLLAEATSEILRHEYRADLADNSIRKLNGQIEYQATGIGHCLTGYEQSRRVHDLLHEELAERQRAPRETPIRSAHEMAKLKRAHELIVDEFSRRKCDR